jgi:hypothetical protein
MFIRLKYHGYQDIGDVVPNAFAYTNYFGLTFSPLDLSSSPTSYSGFADFQHYGTLYKYFRIHSQTVRVEVDSYTVPSSTACDAFTVGTVCYDPDQLSFPVDNVGLNRIGETPGSTLVHFRPHTTMNRLYKRTCRFNNAALLGLTPEEFRNSVGVQGITPAYAVPTKASRAGMNPSATTQMTTIIENLSNGNRKYAARYYASAMIQFFDYTGVNTGN